MDPKDFANSTVNLLTICLSISREREYSGSDGGDPHKLSAWLFSEMQVSNAFLIWVNRGSSKIANELFLAVFRPRTFFIVLNATYDGITYG